jgi:hypothetical protein
MVLIEQEMLIADWQRAKARLDGAKKYELELRNKILPQVLEGKQSGSKTTVFGGFKVTATARLNYTIDEAELDILGEALTEEEKACVEWKPKVNVTRYNKLPEVSALRQAVTVKPGQGALSIKS